MWNEGLINGETLGRYTEILPGRQTAAVPSAALHLTSPTGIQQSCGTMLEKLPEGVANASAEDIFKALKNSVHLTLPGRRSFDNDIVTWTGLRSWLDFTSWVDFTLMQPHYYRVRQVEPCRRVGEVARRSS